MRITNYSKDILLDKNCTYEESLMGSTIIKLQWYDKECVELPAGSAITVDGVTYKLKAPYVPQAENEGKYKYQPEFYHPSYMLDYTPCVYEADSAVEGGEKINQIDWAYTGDLKTLAGYIQSIINKNLSWGVTINCVIDSSIMPVTASCTFNASSISGALKEICNKFSCEWYLDWDGRYGAAKTIYLGKFELHKDAETPVLQTGSNVGAPNNSRAYDDYANYFVVRGGTRNITTKTATGKYVQSNTRLAIVDIDKSNGGEKLQKVLVFDDIYPKLDLYCYNVRKRTRRVANSSEEGGKYVAATYNADGTIKTYKKYDVYYMQLAYPVYKTDAATGNKVVDHWQRYTIDPTKDIVSGGILQGQFKANEEGSYSRLAGREFELTYHTNGETIEEKPEIEDSGVTILAGDFEVVFVTEDSVVIPNDTLYPYGATTANLQNDIITLFNVVLDDTYLQAAKNELKIKANKQIADLMSDQSAYTVKTYPAVWKQGAMDVAVPQAVTYKLGGYQLDARVTKRKYSLVSPYVQELTISQSEVKGKVESLKSEVAAIVGASETSSDSPWYQSVAAKITKYFLRKDRPDTASAHISFLGGLTASFVKIKGYLQFGSYNQGISGGKIDSNGDAELKSLTLRESLTVPELKYNRVSVETGTIWHTSGGGKINKVWQGYNANGASTGSNYGIAKLELQAGEYGAVAVNDLCQGVFHLNEGNDTTTSDGRNGNFHFAGFKTIYFKVKSILTNSNLSTIVASAWFDSLSSEDKQDVIEGLAMNKYFAYELRTVTNSSWTDTTHPQPNMAFAQYANTSNSNRQKCGYETNEYEIMLVGMTTWTYDKENIQYIKGNLNGFALDKEYWNGSEYVTGVINLEGWGIAYGNAYMWGNITQFDRQRSLVSQQLYFCVNNESTAPGELSEWSWSTSPQSPDKDNVNLWEYWEYTYSDGAVETSDAFRAGNFSNDGNSLTVQYSSDGTNWHDTFASGDIYMHTSTDGGDTWSDAIRVVGETGAATYYDYAISEYKTTSSAQTAPTDISSWNDSPIATTTAKPYAWMRIQKKNGSGQNVGSAMYMRVTGDKGANGKNAPRQLYFASKDTPTTPSDKYPSDWETTPPATNSIEITDITNDSTYPWAKSGEWYVSTNKDDGSKSVLVFKLKSNISTILYIDWEVSSEETFDKGYIYGLDSDTRVLTGFPVSGEESGRSQITFGAGEHTLYIAYEKDGTKSCYNDQFKVRLQVGNNIWVVTEKLDANGDYAGWSSPLRYNGTDGSDAVIYKASPSAGVISFSKNSDGTALTPDSHELRCGYVKIKGSTYTQVDSSELAKVNNIDSIYNLFYKREGIDDNWHWYKDVEGGIINIPKDTTARVVHFCISKATSYLTVENPGNVLDFVSVPIQKDGLNPYIGANNNWFINGVDSGLSAVGDDGHSPYISATTKTWWEYDASNPDYQASGEQKGYRNTGINASGNNGSDGADGVQPNLYGYDNALNDGAIHTKDGFAVIAKANSSGVIYASIYAQKAINTYFDVGVYAISCKVRVIDMDDTMPSKFTMYLTMYRGSVLAGRIYPKNYNSTTQCVCDTTYDIQLKFNLTSAYHPYLRLGGLTANTSNALIIVSELKIERADNIVGVCTRFAGLAADSIPQKPNLIRYAKDFAKDWRINYATKTVNGYQGNAFVRYVGGTYRNSTYGNCTFLQLPYDGMSDVIKADTTYTLSWWERGKGTVNVFIQELSENGFKVSDCQNTLKAVGTSVSSSHVMNTDWVLHSITFRTPQTINTSPYIRWSLDSAYNIEGNWVEIAMPKLEECEKATDWCVNEADKIGSCIRPRGEWSSTCEDYVNNSEFRDVVMYNNTHYVVKTGVTTVPKNTLPTNTNYWTSANEMEFVATKLLLAEKAYIQNLQAGSLNTYNNIKQAVDGSGNPIYIPTYIRVGFNKNGVPVLANSINNNVVFSIVGGTLRLGNYVIMCNPNGTVTCSTISSERDDEIVEWA